MTDYTVADTIYLMFTTRAFATGIPTVLAGTPVVSAYENDSITQITAGITLGVSHDGVVGMNLLTIVATGANGFEAGKDYNLVITTGTVGGVSVVGEAVGTFSLGRSAAAVDLANGTDGLGVIAGRLPGALVSGRMDSDVAIIQTAAAQTIRDEIMPTQNAAFDNIKFLFVAASDHVTPVTGAGTMTVTRSIDGGAFGAGTGTGPAEIGNGIYQYDASAADMNGGIIIFRFAATSGTPGAPDDSFLTIVTGGGV